LSGLLNKVAGGFPWTWEGARCGTD